MNKSQLVKLSLLALMILATTLMAQPLIASEGDEGHEGTAGEGEAAHFVLIMGEFFFQVEGLAAGEPLVVPAGQPIKLEIVNEGKLVHEAMFGLHMNGDHGYMENFFEHMGVKAKLEMDAEGAARAVELEIEGLEEVELDPHMGVTLEFTVPESYAGQTFEIGCFIPGHYEAGMKLTLVVEHPTDEDHQDEAMTIQDTDNDGIPDDKDYCPTYPGEELKNGC